MAKVNEQDLVELKKMAITFYDETKKVFSSCKRAILNVDDYAFYGVWGDFKNRKQAIKVANVWAIAFRKPANVQIVDGYYRISIDV